MPLSQERINEILQLLNEDIVEALDMIKDLIGRGNGDFINLYKEYINKPNNFDDSKFRDRVKAFVNLELKNDLGEKKVEDLDFNSLLKLNFKHQIKYFESLAITSNKKLISFVIRDKPNFGQRWLYNRLLILLRNNNLEFHDPPIKLDFEKINFEDLDTVFDAILDSFINDTNKLSNYTLEQKFRLLRKNIDDRVKTKFQIIIFKHAFSFVDSIHFLDFFERLRDIDEELKLDQVTKNKCIIIFVENQEKPYNHQSICFFTEKHELLPLLKEKELKLIDLFKNDNKITIEDLNDWFESNYDHVHEYFKDFLEEICDCEELIGDGNPELVIRNLCKKMKLDFEKKENLWLKY